MNGPLTTGHRMNGHHTTAPEKIAKRVRIAHCIHGVGLGGAQQVIRFIAGGSDRTRFEHFVYASQSGVFHRQIEDAGATVRIVPRHVPKLDPFWVWRLCSAMRQDTIDVVHTHLFGDSLHGYLAAQRDDRPVVMTLHNTAESRSGLQRRGYRWLIDRCDVTVACAEFVRRSFLADTGVRPEVIGAVPNAIAAPPTLEPQAARQAVSERLGVRPNAVVLAGIGRMVPQKAFDAMIAACGWVREQTDQDLQLVLFGEGDLKDALQQQVASAGLEQTVLFAGFRPDVQELMPGIDVVVFSSLQEGLPIALLEAMASGRALVVTRVGGVPEAVDHDAEALVVPPSDPDALRQALLTAVTDDTLRKRLGDAAKQRFARDFAVERMVQSYEALYEQVLRNGKIP